MARKRRSSGPDDQSNNQMGQHASCELLKTKENKQKSVIASSKRKASREVEVMIPFKKNVVLPLAQVAEMKKKEEVGKQEKPISGRRERLSREQEVTLLV